MATATQPKRKTKAVDTSENRLVLGGVSWSMYQALLEVFCEQRVRITYDRGRLEIMTVSSEHARWGHLLNSLLVVLCVELRWSICGLGQMTFSKKTLERGLQPDECYSFKNEKIIRGVKKYDCEKHPPPDLVIEVDISRSSLDRIAMYEAMGVPEVWRWDDKKLEVRVLSKGKYKRREVSSELPGLKPAELVPFLEKAWKIGEVEMLLEFCEWVGEQISAGSLKPKK